jgi:hypothetical protein
VQLTKKTESHMRVESKGENGRGEAPQFMGNDSHLRASGGRAFSGLPARSSGRHELREGIPLSGHSVSLQSPSRSCWIWPLVTPDLATSPQSERDQGMVSERVSQENVSG